VSVCVCVCIYIQVSRKALVAIKQAFSTASSPSAAASTLSMLGGRDRELQEKALVALSTLLKA